MTRNSFLPLKLSVLYVSITFLLSFIGPVIYLRYQYKYWIVFFYLVVVFSFFSFGYMVGLNNRKRSYVKFGNPSAVFSVKLLKISVFISIISLLLEIFYLYSIGAIHLSLSNLAENYFQDIDGSSGIMIFRFAIDFFRVCSCTIGFYYFNRINFSMKFCVFIVAFLILFVTLFGYGQQKSIGDLFIYLAISLLTSGVKSGKKCPRKKRTYIIIGGVLFFFVLSLIQANRYKAIGVTASNYCLRGTGEIGYDTENIIFKLFGNNLGFGMAVILTSYLSIGYYGLSLCLQMPFEWTYGLGSSRALTKLLEKIGIDGISDKTYLGRLGATYGRDGMASWNTIFPWLASDISFFGIPFYFMIIGYIMAKSWKEVLEEDNPISYMMFSILMLMMFYVPANNQLFHSYGSFMSTIVIVVLWLAFRGNFKPINKGNI